MRALIVVALAACRVAPIDYTGKQCPCPDDWQCNLTTQTCTQGAIHDSGVDGKNSDGSMVTSCFNNPRDVLLYSTVGFTDFPTGWTLGSGSWTRQQNELTQMSSANDLAWMTRPVMTSGNLPNYRIVATMHVGDTLSSGGAGIGFRVSPFGAMYDCVFTPKTGEFRLLLTQNGTDTVLASRVLAVPADPAASYTMEINSGDRDHSCCLRGYVDSLIYAPDDTLTVGAPAIVARKAVVGFSSFYAYE